MSTTQIVLALVPIAIAVAAVIVAALLEPWRVRRNQPMRRTDRREPPG
jgi:hypothetical protein